MEIHFNSVSLNFLLFRSHFQIPKALHWDEFKYPWSNSNICRLHAMLTKTFTLLSLFSERNQLNSHLGLVRSYLTSISVAENDFNTPPMENGRMHHMSHTIYLSPTVAWVKLRGTDPQIEQRANRNSSPQSLIFTFSPKAQRN